MQHMNGKLIGQYQTSLYEYAVDCMETDKQTEIVTNCKTTFCLQGLIAYVQSLMIDIQICLASLVCRQSHGELKIGDCRFNFCTEENQFVRIGVKHLLDLGSKRLYKVKN